MARIKKTFCEQYPIYHTKDLQKPVIFVVDMINGFVHEGALHDEEIAAIAPSIAQLIEACACRTIFIADSHPPKAREFASYPPHCVCGTSESEVIKELQPYIQELYRKNSTNTFHAPDFREFLERIDRYQDIIITGCCSDICILQFALTLQSWLNEHSCLNQKIILPIDLIDTYHIDGIHDAWSENAFSIRNMAANGITVVRSIERG